MSTEATTKTITEAVAMECIDLEGLSTPIAADFAYDAADPFAVSIVFKAEPASARWTFARELLIEGYFDPTGDGDVHVWPCLSADGGAVVIIELDSPSGEALVQVSSREVDAFIQHMLALVPLGAEEQHVDLDAEIAQLFAA